MESSKKSLYLFEVQLDRDQLESMIQLSPDILKKLFFRCARIFQKQLNNREALAIFLDNYRMIIELHSTLLANSLSVDLCLHFALLYSQFLLLQGSESQAKNILKQTQNYLDLEGVDPMLISLCLNNLAYLYSKQGKYYKSLAIALKTVSILQEHLEHLSIEKKKEQLTQDVIVFVNVLIVTQRVLTNILKTNSKTFFKSLFKIVNRMGYSFSQKYLGNDSIFARKFYLSEDSILLPVYLEQEEEGVEEQEERFKQFQERVAQELEHIYTSLKELNLQPEIYYIKEHSVHQSKSEQKKSIVEIQTPPPEQEFSVSYTECFQIADWQAEVSFFREASDLLVTTANNSYQFLGHVQFKLEKNRAVFFEKISEEKLIKIINCLNIYDVLPFEYQLKKLTSSQFVRRVFLNFVSCTSQGQLLLHSRAFPIIEPFEMKFCGQTTLILVYHICFKKFRIGICPMNSSETIYLEIDFKCKQIYRLFKLTQFFIEGISQLSQKYHSPEQLKAEDVQFGKFKKVQMINSEVFKGKIVSILQQFEVFITEDDDAQMMNELLTSTSITDNNYKYYHFTMDSKERGQFYEFRYRQNANYIEIYTKNNFKTYSLQGLNEAKGNIIITPLQFSNEFGIGLKLARKWLQCFYGILVQKYTLRVFEEPIQEMQEDRFQENAISQMPFICKFYKRKFILFENYMLPLTVELISVSTEKPIGIKVYIYEPIKGHNSGLFIHVNADYWENPPQAATVKENSGLDEYLGKEQACHNFKKDYFLTRWLTEQGFQLIFSKIAIVNRVIEIRGHSGKFVRLQQLL